MNLTNIEIYENNQILYKSAYNGRVNIVEAPSPDVQFKMQERIAIKNKTTEYREAIAGDLESNLLATVYFSADNIQIIQNGLRAGVYKMSNDKYVIAPQNMDTLKIIMRSIFLQYAEFDMNNITKEVSRLNNMVLDYAVQSVYNEAVGYMKYCEDQSTLAVPLELPQQVDREFKQLEMKPFV
jgi:phosphopantetheine adenylyltransferase